MCLFFPLLFLFPFLGLFFSFLIIYNIPQTWPPSQKNILIFFLVILHGFLLLLQPPIMPNHLLLPPMLKHTSNHLLPPINSHARHIPEHPPAASCHSHHLPTPPAAS